MNMIFFATQKWIFELSKSLHFFIEFHSFVFFTFFYSPESIILGSLLRVAKLSKKSYFNPFGLQQISNAPPPTQIVFGLNFSPLPRGVTSGWASVVLTILGFYKNRGLGWAKKN